MRWVHGVVELVGTYDPFSSSSYFLVGRFSSAMNSTLSACSLSRKVEPAVHICKWRCILTFCRETIPHIPVLRVIPNRMIPTRLVPVDEATSGETHGIADTVVSSCSVSSCSRSAISLKVKRTCLLGLSRSPSLPPRMSWKSAVLESAHLEVLAAEKTYCRGSMYTSAGGQP